MEDVYYMVENELYQLLGDSDFTTTYEVTSRTIKSLFTVKAKELLEKVEGKFYVA